MKIVSSLKANPHNKHISMFLQSREILCSCFTFLFIYLVSGSPKIIHVPFCLKEWIAVTKPPLSRGECDVIYGRPLFKLSRCLYWLVWDWTHFAYERLVSVVIVIPDDFYWEWKATNNNKYLFFLLIDGKCYVSFNCKVGS